MASTPTVPTSFLPHPSATAVRASTGGVVEVLSYLAFVASGAIFVLAIGVFLYGQVLAKTQASDDAQLAAAAKNIDKSQVRDFIRLHDRLTTGQTLLSKHVALSGVFPVIEAVMPSTIRFSTMHIAFDDKGALKLDASGVARSFNSLAVASAAFATDPRIQGALFSGITPTKDGSVNFSLTGTIDPKVITFNP